MITNISTDSLYPHPCNPREDLGDLEELAESIKARGVMQNLTVVPEEDGFGGYRIVIGHRRHAAAKLAGLAELPCAVAEMDEKTQLSTMLLENMQRSDLTVPEQAQGFQTMMSLGSSVKEISEQTGFSQQTVRHRLEIAKLPAEKLRAAWENGATLLDFIELEKIKDPENKERLLDVIGTNSFQWELRKAAEKEEAARNLPRLMDCLKDIEEFPSGENAWEYEFLGKLPLKDGTEAKLPEGGVRYYTFRFDGGNINLYGDRKARDATESDAREESMRSRHEELLKIYERMRELRIQHAKGITRKELDRGKDEIMRAAIFAVAYGRLERSVAGELLGLDDPGYTEIAEIQSGWIYKLFVVAYSSSENNLAHYHRYQPWVPSLTYAPDTREYKTYDLLKHFGYRMSEEEEQIVDGTHPLYGDDEYGDDADDDADEEEADL
jgi:ParB family chromosome partitioning protein